MVTAFENVLPIKDFRNFKYIGSGWEEIDFCEYPEPFLFIDTRFAVAICGTLTDGRLPYVSDI
jgi:hypothetical protein